MADPINAKPKACGRAPGADLALATAGPAARAAAPLPVVRCVMPGLGGSPCPLALLGRTAIGAELAEPALIPNNGSLAAAATPKDGPLASPRPSTEDVRCLAPPLATCRAARGRSSSGKDQTAARQVGQERFSRSQALAQSAESWRRLPHTAHCQAASSGVTSSRQTAQTGASSSSASPWVPAQGRPAGNVAETWGEAFVRDSSASYFENSAALLGLHILVVWKYHSFLRDALLARHVTRIAVLDPPAEAQDHQPETWAVLVETGPWARRLQLARQSQPTEGVGEDAVDKPRDKVPFGQLLQLGLLHVDTQRGEVVDQDTFDFLLTGDLTVVSEEVTTDVATLKYAFVSPDKLVPFLAEATLPDRSGSSIWQSLQDHEWLHRAFQVNGGRAMGFFGQLALSMGIGSVFVIPLFMSRQR